MNILFASALAEETAELAQVLEGVSKEEALAAGTVLGMSMGVAIVIGLIYFVLRVIADWKIFTKAGRAGWKSIVPVLCEYEEFDMCWKGSIGLIYAIGMILCQCVSMYVKQPQNWLVILMGVVSLGLLVLQCMQSMRLARSFGKGTGFGIGLFFLGPIFRLVLGFGSAQYIGHPDR